MQQRQKRVFDSLVRVRGFLEENPAPGALSYSDARSTLDDVIDRLDEHAGTQVLGHELSRAEVRRQNEQIEVIYELHMRPVVALARAQIEPGSDVGLPAGLRLPRTTLTPSGALALSHAMIEAARPFEALLVSKGMPADFLAQFEAARQALVNMRGNRETQVGRRITAGAGLEVQLRRGRRVVGSLDAIVRAAFRGDDMTLSAWRSAKRIHLASGGGARAVEEGIESVTEAAA